MKKRFKPISSGGFRQWKAGRALTRNLMPSNFADFTVAIDNFFIERGLPTPPVEKCLHAWSR